MASASVSTSPPPPNQHIANASGGGNSSTHGYATAKAGGTFRQNFVWGGGGAPTTLTVTATTTIKFEDFSKTGTAQASVLGYTGGDAASTLTRTDPTGSPYVIPASNWVVPDSGGSYYSSVYVKAQASGSWYGGTNSAFVAKSDTKVSYVIVP